jgi:hypothetical protein
VQTYFIELFKKFCIFSWFTEHNAFNLTKREAEPMFKEQLVTYIYGKLKTKEGTLPLIIREEKNLL